MGSDIAWCPLCKRDITTSSRFSWVIFLGLCVLAVIPGIIYAVWALTRDRQCPICKSKVLYETEAETDMAAPVSKQPPLHTKGNARRFSVGVGKKRAVLAVLPALAILVIAAFVIGSPAVSNPGGWKISPITAEYRAEILETPLEEWQLDKANADRAECLQNAVMYGGFDARVASEMAGDCHEDADDQIFDMRRANWEATKLEP